MAIPSTTTNLAPGTSGALSSTYYAEMSSFVLGGVVDCTLGILDGTWGLVARTRSTQGQKKLLASSSSYAFSRRLTAW